MRNCGWQVCEAYVRAGDMPEAEATAWNFSDDLDSAPIDPQAVNYTLDFLRELISLINADLSRIPS